MANLNYLKIFAILASVSPSLMASNDTLNSLIIGGNDASAKCSLVVATNNQIVGGITTVSTTNKPAIKVEASKSLTFNGAVTVSSATTIENAGTINVNDDFTFSNSDGVAEITNVANASLIFGGGNKTFNGTDKEKSKISNDGTISFTDATVDITNISIDGNGTFSLKDDMTAAGGKFTNVSMKGNTITMPLGLIDAYKGTKSVSDPFKFTFDSTNKVTLDLSGNNSINPNNANDITDDMSAQYYALYNLFHDSGDQKTGVAVDGPIEVDYTDSANAQKKVTKNPSDGVQYIAALYKTWDTVTFGNNIKNPATFLVGDNGEQIPDEPANPGGDDKDDSNKKPAGELKDVTFSDADSINKAISDGKNYDFSKVTDIATNWQNPAFTVDAISSDWTLPADFNPEITVKPTGANTNLSISGKITKATLKIDEQVDSLEVSAANTYKCEKAAGINLSIKAGSTYSFSEINKINALTISDNSANTIITSKIQADSLSVSANVEFKGGLTVTNATTVSKGTLKV